MIVAEAEPETDPGADEAERRSALYGLLATVFWREPTAALLDELKWPAVREAFAACGVAPPEVGAEDDGFLEDWAVEFARLFVGPGKHIPPYGSVFLDAAEGSLWGRSTAWVKAFFDAVGYVPEGRSGSIPDHFALELDLMRALTAAEAVSLAGHDGDEVVRLRGLQRLFLSRHLGKWSDAFCDAVIAETRLDFYRAFGALAKAFLGTERSSLGSQGTAP